MYSVVDPSCELLLELDERGAITTVWPHVGELLPGPHCCVRDLVGLLPADVAGLLADRADVVRATRTATTLEVPRLGWRARIAPHAGGVVVLLRGAAIDPTEALWRTTMSDDSFWQLFEAAPLPLVIEVADTPTGQGASRFNRRFTEVFGYTSEDIPTVQHWWPLAYPDPVQRATNRDEWFRRVHQAMTDQGRIAPMDATVTCKDGSLREIEFFAAAVGDRHVVVFVDLTEHNRILRQLRDAKAEVQTLSELLPVCAWCKKLRDDRGYWQLLEEFVARRTGATVTHGICPECAAQLVPGGR